MPNKKWLILGALGVGALVLLWIFIGPEAVAGAGAVGVIADTGRRRTQRKADVLRDEAREQPKVDAEADAGIEERAQKIHGDIMTSADDGFDPDADKPIKSKVLDV